MSQWEKTAANISFSTDIGVTGRLGQCQKESSPKSRKATRLYAKMWLRPYQLDHPVRPLSPRREWVLKGWRQEVKTGQGPK